MQKLKKAESLLLKAETALLVLILSVMVGLSFIQVVLRDTVHRGILWADPLLRHLVLWAGFLGAALAAADAKHFAWEPAAQKGGRAGAAMRLTADLAAIVISALLTCASWSFWNDDRAAGDILVQIGGVPVAGWWLSTIIPLGFALITLHFAARAAESAAALKTGEAAKH